MKPCDLFILAAEPSGDLHGSELISELKTIHPDLSIHAVSGPRMRPLDIHTHANMEDLQVMGFFDVLVALPKLMRLLCFFRKTILNLQPKACVFIDYPEFHILLEKALRKSGYQGKLIHYICPSVWAWRKSRINTMAKHLNLLLALFPFEPACFQSTSLSVKYVGNPVASLVKKYAHHPLWKEERFRGHLLVGIFPGSRTKEIYRNLPLQLQAFKNLLKFNPNLKLAVSLAEQKREVLVKKMLEKSGLTGAIIPPEEHYELMKNADLAIATSGTVTLELALHGTPTVVTFAIKRWDQFLAQKILKINLPFYCIANILLQKEVFPELFGTNLTLARLTSEAKRLLLQKKARAACQTDCQNIKEILTNLNPSLQAAKEILSTFREKQ